MGGSIPRAQIAKDLKHQITMHSSPLWLERTAKAHSFTGASAAMGYSSRVKFRNVLSARTLYVILEKQSDIIKILKFHQEVYIIMSNTKIKGREL